MVIVNIKKSLKIPKGVSRSCSSKDTQYNGERKKHKTWNNRRQNVTQKNKDWAIWTLIKKKGWNQVYRKGLVTQTSS